jgi:hypothetical protein
MKNEPQTFRVNSQRNLEIIVYISDDGALTVQVDGSTDNDPDCKQVRVYVNDGYASQYLSPGEPGYGVV